MVNIRKISKLSDGGTFIKIEPNLIVKIDDRKTSL